MKCPVCGGEATLVGLPAGIYPAAFRCYRHGEHNFSGSGPEVDAECARARARSRAYVEEFSARDDHAETAKVAK